MREASSGVEGIMTRRYWECGPLLLDADKSRAIMDDEDLCLDENEFDALYLLVKCEGSPMTQEQLYKAVWEIPDTPDCREAAWAAMRELVDKVNAAGKGVVRIDTMPGETYVIKRHHII